MCVSVRARQPLFQQHEPRWRWDSAINALALSIICCDDVCFSPCPVPSFQPILVAQLHFLSNQSKETVALCSHFLHLHQLWICTLCRGSAQVEPCDAAPVPFCATWACTQPTLPSLVHGYVPTQVRLCLLSSFLLALRSRNAFSGNVWPARKASNLAFSRQLCTLLQISCDNL